MRRDEFMRTANCSQAYARLIQPILKAEQQDRELSITQASKNKGDD